MRNAWTVVLAVMSDMHVGNALGQRVKRSTLSDPLTCLMSEAGNCEMKSTSLSWE